MYATKQVAELWKLSNRRACLESGARIRNLGRHVVPIVAEIESDAKLAAGFLARSWLGLLFLLTPISVLPCILVFC